MNWHILKSMILAGLAFAVLRDLGESPALATGFAAGLFLVYWVKVAEGLAD